MRARRAGGSSGPLEVRTTAAGALQVGLAELEELGPGADLAEPAPAVLAERTQTDPAELEEPDPAKPDLAAPSEPAPAVHKEPGPA